ncbi:MAG TPA: hypothetical protein DCQ06_03095 [Myxococcales bacterium]|nr:hypothetical protein [Myxococcales bacterium]
MAYMYHHNNTAAWRTVEMIELLNGARKPGDFIKGLDLTEWIDQINAGKGRFQTRGLEEATTMVDRIANSVFSEYWAGRRTPITAEDEAFQDKHGHHKWAHKHLQTMYDAGHLSGLGNSPQARLDRIKGKGLEKLLIHPELKMAAGFAPDADLSEELLDAVSPVRQGLSASVRDRDRIRQEIAASRNMYLPEMLDDALMGLAREVKGKTSEEVYQIVRESVYTAVFAHEVGHSLGLMHNFGGSDDAVNYFDGYWKLRDDGKVGPRLNDPISDKEIDGKIYNYAYSSVMDYAGRLTIDGLGVGKYDRAAILYGYSNKVEVYKDPGSVPQRWKQWFDGRSEILQFFVLGPQAVHYTTIYNETGPKMYLDDNRMLVDAGTLSTDLSQASVDGQTYYRVPYVYCTHGRSDLSDSCLTRDFGADSMERMQHFLAEWDTWYLTRAFVRGNLGMNNNTYANRYYRRIYNRIKQWHDIYGLYAAFLPQFYAPQTLNAFLTDPVNGWGGNTWAIQNAFQYLVETILMPDVGSYAKRPQADGSSLWQAGGGGNLSLGVTDARYYSTSWSFGGQGGRECGYFWYECLERIGFYVDKVMAMMAISDSRTNFVARANPIDIREWHVSYYNTFSESIRTINAALQSGDWSRVGPFRDGAGKIRFPNYAGKLTTIHPDAIDPAADFTVQLYFSLLGQANFMTNYDRAFLDEAQVWIKGTGKGPEVAASNLVEFTDVDSGMTYAALKRERGAGKAMIEQAQALFFRSNECSGPACASNVNANQRAVATAELKKYMQLLKAVAEMSFLMNYGHPLNP